MRDKHLYLIEILQRGYTAKAKAMYPNGDVLVIKQGDIDDGELMAIKGSEATLSLLCRDAGDPYLNLFSVDPQEYKLRVQIERDGEWTPFWDGFLTPSTYTQAYAKPPYHVSIAAVDGLSLLRDIPYLDDAGNQYSGISSIHDIICAIMAKIGVDAIDFGNVPTVSPSQAESSLAVVGVDATAIYTLHGEDAMCLDVLEGLLTTWGLQIFQSFGRWRVRKLSALATSVWTSPDATINNGGEPIPLYSDDTNEGISVSATLSLLAPYRKMTVSRPNASEDDGTMPSMLDGARWRDVSTAAKPATWRPHDRALRISNTKASGKLEDDRYYGVRYIADSTVTPGLNRLITVTVDVINISGVKGNVRIGMVLVDSSESPDEWLKVDSDGNWVKSGTKALRWDASQSKWVALSDVSDESDADQRKIPHQTLSYTDSTTEQEVPSQRYIPFDMPFATGLLESATCSYEVPSIPYIEGVQSWTVVVILLGGKGKNLPALEISSPIISIGLNQAIVPDLEVDSAEISITGIGDIEYNQSWGDNWQGLSSGKQLDAPLIDIAKATPVGSFVHAGQRSLLADIVSIDVRMMRGYIARQIEGDVYTKHLVDLDGIWGDRDGRTYYATSLTRYLKRGILSLQLREFKALARGTEITYGATFNEAAIDSVVALDTSAYIAVKSSRSILRYDAQKDKVTTFITSPNGSYPVVMNEGQRCVSFVLYNGIQYTLLAYDTHGRELSRVDNAIKIVPETYAYTASVINSARYDANIHVWTLVGGDSTLTFTALADSVGYTLDYAILSLSGYQNPSNLRLMPNGYSFMTTAANGVTTTYWLNHALADKVANLNTWGNYIKVLAVNEIYAVVDNGATGQIEVYERLDTKLGLSTPIVRWGSAYYDFVGANNGVVVVKSKTSGVVVFDGRAKQVYSITNGGFGMRNSVIWLSGDTLYAAMSQGARYMIARRYLVPNTAPVEPQ